jgi:hypothetical protein
MTTTLILGCTCVDPGLTFAGMYGNFMYSYVLKKWQSGRCLLFPENGECASLVNSTSLPTRLWRSSARHVRIAHKYYLYGRKSVPRRVSKSILLAPNQYRALRSGRGERLHPASPANNTQDGGEEPGEGDDAAESREG